MEFVDLKKQYRTIQNSIERRLQNVLESAQFIMGPEIAELESALATRIGARHCVTCSSGTDALLLAMMVLNIGPGDEVITSPFTFIATGEMIALLGAKPVFVDIDPRTYNIDVALIPAAITPRTRAIMPVSLYGQCADMDRINAVAKSRSLPVIEDAAQSFGAMHRGRPSCNLSTIGCTSFFPSKPLGCYGDGGACFTNDDGLATAMREIRVHGQDRRYHHLRLGLNGRLDTLQAAILLAKLEIFDQELEQRNRIADRYSESLKGIADVPYIESHNRCAWAQYTIQIADRAKAQQSLAIKGIPTAIHYPTPIHLQPAFDYLGISKGNFPKSEYVSERVMSLPMHPYLTDEEIENVVSALAEVLPKAAPSTGPSALSLSRLK